MSLLHEVTLERLWSKYENRFGAPPPVTNASFDEAISLIREQLNGRSVDEEDLFDKAAQSDPVDTYAVLAGLDGQIADAYRSEVTARP